MHIKCRNCPDTRYKNCAGRNTIINGRLACEANSDETASGGCDKCGQSLKIGKFAYEPNLREFWCGDCLRNLYAETFGGENERSGDNNCH
jgi:hypothetical protein